jgi:hypothetical protein
VALPIMIRAITTTITTIPAIINVLFILYKRILNIQKNEGSKVLKMYSFLMVSNII